MRATDSLTTCVVSSTTAEVEDEGSGELVVPTSAPDMKEASLGSTYELDSATEGVKMLDAENTLEFEELSETGRISEDEGTASGASEVTDAGSKTEVDKGSGGAVEDAAIVMAASEMLVEMPRKELTASPRLEATEDGSTMPNEEAVRDVVALPPRAELNEATSLETTARDA